MIAACVVIYIYFYLNHFFFILSERNQKINISYNATILSFFQTKDINCKWSCLAYYQRTSCFSVEHSFSNQLKVLKSLVKRP